MFCRHVASMPAWFNTKRTASTAAPPLALLSQ
jgi:hypothetical protein